MSKKISVLEKKAMARIAWDMLRADGLVDDAEVKVYNIFCEALQMSKTAMQEAKRLSVLRSLSIVEKLSYEYKDNILKVIVILMLADFDIAPEEIDAILFFINSIEKTKKREIKEFRKELEVIQEEMKKMMDEIKKETGEMGEIGEELYLTIKNSAVKSMLEEAAGEIKDMF